MSGSPLALHPGNSPSAVGNWVRPRHRLAKVVKREVHKPTGDQNLVVKFEVRHFTKLSNLLKNSEHRVSLPDEIHMFTVGSLTSETSPLQSARIIQDSEIIIQLPVSSLESLHCTSRSSH